jgi:AcrR family transcriptional regulator
MKEAGAQVPPRHVMARPVNANAEETRGRILDAASQLFARHGYEGASVRQIASAAGVSLGMIRHYFGSKDGLYDACIASAYGIYDELGRHVREELGNDDPAKALAEAVRAGFRHARQHIWACRLVLWDMMQSDRWRSERNDEHMVPFILELATAMARPLGRPASELALATRTLIFLVVRYATADEDEIATLLAGGDPDAKADETTMSKVEEHLVDLAERLYR